MNALAQAIQSQGLTGTEAEIVTALGASVTISTNSVPQSLVGVGNYLALQGVDLSLLVNLRNLIRTLPVGGDTFEGMLLTAGGDAGGVDFSNALVRGQIQYNQAHPSTTKDQQTILAGMLLIGVQPGPLWQKLGLSGLPSQSDVTTALAQISDQQAFAALLNEVVNPLIATGSTVAAFKAAVAVYGN